ncbi:MAG: carboxylesterase family protein [Steroidobacteraceae bacterium]
MTPSGLVRCLAVVLLTAIQTAVAASLVVTLPQGQLRGAVRGSTRVFYNIPFAAPPVGELRWRAPKSAPNWPGIRDATAPGAACAQQLVRGAERFPRGTSEDCLYLNVFTPATAKRGTALPVMVWIHGGSFRWGSAMDPAFDGAALARAGVVLVAINYRLDRFGRFAHPALYPSQGDEARGNYALLDQVAALQWVRQNIADFGGDAERVTIFGCSAGGVSVDFLMAAPGARGLFQRAIAQSGSVVPEGERRIDRKVGRFDSLLQDGREFAAHFGIAEDRDTAAKLRALTADEVISYPRKDFSMQPVVDGRLIVDDPARVFARGEQAPVPFMSGAASFEASLIQAFNLPLVAILAGIPRGEAEAAYRIADEKHFKDVFFGDNLFLSSAYFLTSQMARTGQRGYLYEYTYINEAQRGSNPGAYHCSETPRIFGTEWRGETASVADRRMGDQLRAIWVQFAKSGQPGLAGAAKWPAHRLERPVLMQLDTKARRLDDPYPSRMQLQMRRYADLLATGNR